MGRPRSRGVATVFGRFLDDRGITDSEAAAELEVSRTYVGMLARGDEPPSLALSFRVADWARRRAAAADGDPSPVPVESWKEIVEARRA